MTDNEMRITIAEARGWTCVDRASDGTPLWWESANGIQVTTQTLPDYPNDLNAMREVELQRFNNPLERVRFRRTLRNIVSRSIRVAEDRTADSPDTAAIFASAREHAEAFLRHLGLYEHH